MAKLFSIKKIIKYVLYYGICRRIDGKNSSKAILARLRLWCLKSKFKFCGNDVNIQSGISIVGFCNISIGNGSGIGRNAYLFANAEIIIGDNVMIAPEVIIHTSNHIMKREVPMIEQGSNHIPVKIGNDVWIATRVVILSGVNIADGCVIAAGAVLTKNTEPYCIYAGVPAVKIGSRK